MVFDQFYSLSYHWRVSRICPGSALSVGEALKPGMNPVWQIRVSPVPLLQSIFVYSLSIQWMNFGRRASVHGHECLREHLLDYISGNNRNLRTLPRYASSLFFWNSQWTLNSEWPACACHSSKAVTVGHISLWPGSDVTLSDIPAAHYHEHAKHRALSAAHRATPPHSLSPPPRTHHHLHQHLCHRSPSEMTPPRAWSKCAFHTGGWPKQINQPHAS